MYIECQTYDIDTKQWSLTPFESKKKYLEFVDSHIKYPGEYNIKYSNGLWNEQAEYFDSHNESYPSYVYNSMDFKRYWINEKDKCRFDGCLIYKSGKENLEFAVPCLYYWYLNYTPIYDKEEKRLAFAKIWDSDLHFYLCCLSAIINGEHMIVLKKRQWGSSLKFTSMLLNAVWFGNNAKVKMFAYSGTHVENSWIFLEGYRDHLNKHFGYNRGFDPNKFLDWQVRRKRNDGTYTGNMSILKGLSTEKDASKPVGGGITMMFGEEAGINPNLNKTHAYAQPAVSLGGITTGFLAYAGSVGELDKCEPLKEFMYKPTVNGFKSFENRCEGDEELGPQVGFFAPEWWNYKYEDKELGEIISCYDEWGNTDKEKALKIIYLDRKKQEERSPESYRYYCSQRPLSIQEAFSHRKESIFPQALLARQEYRIDRGDYPYKVYDIERSGDGKPMFVKAVYPEIERFPYSPRKNEVPYSCIKVWEPPVKELVKKRGNYLAAVDPIMTDKTTTSESLFSIIIYKNLTEIKYTEGGVEKTRLEGDHIVASYTGRKSDVNKTNELAELLIEMYNAFTVVETDVDNFVRHMISKNKQGYLASKDDLPFLKGLDIKQSSHQEYGVKTNSSMWTLYINKILEYLKEELGAWQKSDGSEGGKIYGVERIKDKRLIKELKEFTTEKGNYDQTVTLGLVLALAKSRQANGIVSKVDDRTDIKVDKNLYKVDRVMFKNLEKNTENLYKSNRSAFKNLK